MASVWPVNFVIANDNDIIGLKFIESLNFLNDAAQQTINKLKDDQTLLIRTTSGKEYILSAKKQYAELSPRFSIPVSYTDIISSIADKWTRLLNSN